MRIEVTRYAKLKERRMVSHNVSEGIEPRNMCIALGQGFLHPEARIATRDTGECVSDVPGSKSIARFTTELGRAMSFSKEASNKLKR